MDPFNKKTKTNQEHHFAKLYEVLYNFYLPNEIDYIKTLFSLNNLQVTYNPKNKNTIQYRYNNTKDKGFGTNTSNFGNIMILHHGQRKLAYTEIQCLTHFLQSPTDVATIVYAGAAPCTHLPILLKLFPNTIWHLYDPAPFDFNLKQYHNVHTNRAFFTHDVAKIWRNNCDIFISDIRLNTSESQIKNEMQWQMEWAQIIEPKLGSMVKYRPPYTIPMQPNDPFNYMDGYINMQTRAPPFSTEARLISSNEQIRGKLVEHDPVHYEDFCYQYNMRRIWQTIDFDENDELIKIDGYDRCHDCAMEVLIWKEFKIKYRIDTPIHVLMDLVLDVTRQKLINVEKHAGNRVTTKEGVSYHGYNHLCVATERVAYAVDEYCKENHIPMHYIKRDTDKDLIELEKQHLENSEFYNQPAITEFKPNVSKFKVDDYIKEMYTEEEIKFINEVIHENKLFRIYDKKCKPTLKYRPNADKTLNLCGKPQNLDNMMNFNSGYRKRVFSEIELFTRFLKTYDEKLTIISLVQFPCIYIKALKILFPNLEWIFYSTGVISDEYMESVKTLIGVKYNKIPFTVQDAKLNKCDIFLCERKSRDKDIIEIIRTLAPRVCSAVYFFPEYSIKEDKFIGGDLYYLSRNAAHSIETRIISTPDQYIKDEVYDIEKYNDHMFEHNLRRIWGTIDADKKYTQIRGYDRCHDCVHESTIVEEYRRKFNSKMDEIEILNMIAFETKTKLQSICKDVDKSFTANIKSGHVFHGIYADLPAAERIDKCIQLFCNLNIRHIK